MSLINQMLRDLEQRNQQTPSINQTQPLDIQISPLKTQPKRYGSGWVAGLLTITAISGLFWQSQQTTPTITVSAPPAITLQTPMPAAPIQAPVAAASDTLQPQPEPALTKTTEQPAVETNIPKPETQSAPQTQQSATAKLELAAVEPTKAGSKPAPVQPPKTVKSPAPADPVQQAEKLYRQSGNSQSALMRRESLEEVLQLDPRHLAARQQLLKILVQEHADLALKQFLDESLAWFPDNLGFITTLAHYHVQQKNFAAAIETLERVDSFRINDPHYLALLAASYQQQQQFSQAQTVYQKLTQLQPEKAENWLGLGICADKLQQNSSALDAYQQALHKNTLNSAVVDYINQRLSALTR